MCDKIVTVKSSDIWCKFKVKNSLETATQYSNPAHKWGVTPSAARACGHADP